MNVPKYYRQRNIKLRGVQSDRDFLTMNRIAGGIMRKSKISGALTEFKIQRNKK